MTWASVIAVLLQLFGPVLAEWLRKLLDDTAKRMPAEPSADPEVFVANLAELFDFARGRTWWWQGGRRAAIRLAERAAVRRADAIRLALQVRGSPVPSLTAFERAQLKAALTQ